MDSFLPSSRTSKQQISHSSSRLKNWLSTSTSVQGWWFTWKIYPNIKELSSWVLFMHFMLILIIQKNILDTFHKSVASNSSLMLVWGNQYFSSRYGVFRKKGITWSYFHPIKYGSCITKASRMPIVGAHILKNNLTMKNKLIVLQKSSSLRHQKIPFLALILF